VETNGGTYGGHHFFAILHYTTTVLFDEENYKGHFAVIFMQVFFLLYDQKFRKHKAFASVYRTIPFYTGEDLSKKSSQVNNFNGIPSIF
jgi:hypothetical protein